MTISDGLRFLSIALFLVPMACLSNAAHAQGRGPASVFVETAELKAFSNEIEALGTLRANERVDLTVNVSDRVTQIYFDDGQRVKKGDTLLIQLQGQQAAQVEGAVARVEEARSAVDRMKPLIEDGAVSQMAFDEAQRDLTLAESELVSLRIEKNERVLTAPFDGVLGFRQVSVGSYLQPGQVVATLIDDSEMKLDFDVPSVFVSKLSPGVSIVATTDDYPDQTFEGEIQNVGTEIDAVTRAVTVRAIIPNPDGKLRPGTLMNVTVNAAPSDAVAIPEKSIQPRGPKTFVFVVVREDGKDIARQREVETGRRQAGSVEILSGLQPDDRVVTEGIIRVREGAEVVIRDEAMLYPKSGASGSSTDMSRAR